MPTAKAKNRSTTKARKPTPKTKARATKATSKTKRQPAIAILDAPKPSSFASALARLNAAPDERGAVDGEKVATPGIQRKPGIWYSVRDGDVWAQKPDGSPAKRVTSIGFEMNPKFLYYLDGDGDVARRRR